MKETDSTNISSMQKIIMFTESFGFFLSFSLSSDDTSAVHPNFVIKIIKIIKIIASTSNLNSAFFSIARYSVCPCTRNIESTVPLPLSLLTTYRTSFPSVKYIVKKNNQFLPLTIFSPLSLSHILSTPQKYNTPWLHPLSESI